jgi:adenylate cyclase, class 2
MAMAETTGGPGSGGDGRGPTLEVEAKVSIDDPAALRAVLHRLGASTRPAGVEDDAFFAHPGRDLVARDEALRLRRLAPGPPGSALFELTYKGPRQEGAYKAREERTVRLADDPTALMAALGFSVTVRLRKTRERHHLGAVEVTLDHVEGLGWFAEVEAMGSGAREAEAAVQAALRELGLDGRPRVTDSYVELALAAGAPAAARE